MTFTNLRNAAAAALAVALMTTSLPALAQEGAQDPHSVLRAFSEQARASKLAGAVSLASVGAAATAAGLVVDLRFDGAHGRAVWGVGLGGIAAGAMTFFLPSALELLTKRHGSATGIDAVEALERDWRRASAIARISRRIRGWVNLGLGVAAVGTGATFAAGAGGLDQDARSGLTLGLMLAGGAMAGAGAMALLAESDVEKGYRIAFGADDQASGHNLSLGVTVLPSGTGGVRLSGRF